MPLLLQEMNVSVPVMDWNVCKALFSKLEKGITQCGESSFAVAYNKKTDCSDRSPSSQFRLMTDSAVADGDGAALGKSNGRLSYNHGADKHHGPVRQLVTGGLHVRALRLDLTHTHTALHTNMSRCSLLCIYSGA